MGILWRSGNFVGLIYNEGCDQGDGCPTRYPLTRPAPAHQQSLSSEAFGHPLQPHAPSLRKLVSGYECGRVFPAGVGPGSPSREDAANWLPSRFSLSVETRRRYGWLRMVFPGARLFRAPIWCSLGGVAARERQGTLSRRAW